MIKTISEEEFKEKLDSNDYTLIDVRTQEEHDEKKIADSIVIDISHSDSGNKLSALEKDKKYLIYCFSGVRSGNALEVMNQMGFDEVYDLTGGISNWSY